MKNAPHQVRGRNSVCVCVFFQDPLSISVSVLTLLRSGPGSYDLFERGLAQLSFKQAFFARSRKGGFGSTVQRDFIYNKELLKSPGPAQYEVRTTIITASRR